MVAIKRFDGRSKNRNVPNLSELSTIVRRYKIRHSKASIPRHLIAQRAHCLWEISGRLQGHDAEYWIEAERQLTRETHPVFGRLVPLEKSFQVGLRWLKSLPLLDLLKLFCNLLVVLALITFIANQDVLYHRESLMAWQTITSSVGQTGNGGRKEAIEFLVSRPLRFPLPVCGGEVDYPSCVFRQPRQSLAGLDVGVEDNGNLPVNLTSAGSGAYLEGLQVPNANLSGANLQNAMLLAANLQQTDLDSANLHNALLSRANLQNAILSEANLQSAILSEANLYRAILSGANLQGAMLNLANLQDAFLIEANLAGVQLGKANLRGTHLWKSHLNTANLQFANLQGAHLWKSDLRGANLSGANLQQAHLDEANLQGAIYTSEKSGCPIDGLDSCPTQFPDDFNHEVAGTILWMPHSN